MVFQYAYRDQNNDRHEGTVVASSKDDAFRKLRASGIKPFFVAPAPGLINGILRFGKRGAAIVVLSVVAAVSIYFAIRRIPADGSLRDAAGVFDSQTRRQVIGDAAIIEKGLRTGWRDVFPCEGERFLASFAVPGVEAGQRNTSEDEILTALARKVGIEESDGIEARQIKSMVEGMKNELRRFLEAGGTIAGYGQRLVDRQDAEIGYYQRAVRNVETAKKSGKDDASVMLELDRQNAALRSMGIRLVTMPEGRAK